MALYDVAWLIQMLNSETILSPRRAEKGRPDRTSLRPTGLGFPNPKPSLIQSLALKMALAHDKTRRVRRNGVNVQHTPRGRGAGGGVRGKRRSCFGIR